MATIRRHANARWQGTGKDGNGCLTTQSGTLRDRPYSFTARLGDGQGTNPEELIAAAHAGCFAMALAFQPESLKTEARLSMEQDTGGAGWAIAAITLRLRAGVSGLSKDAFDRGPRRRGRTTPSPRRSGRRSRWTPRWKRSGGVRVSDGGGGPTARGSPRRARRSG